MQRLDNLRRLSRVVQPLVWRVDPKLGFGCKQGQATTVLTPWAKAVGKVAKEAFYPRNKALSARRGLPVP